MKYSINDLVLLDSNSTRQNAINKSVELAILAEYLGYQRIWYGEHHLSSLMMSCSPECIIPLVASKTSKINIGSGAVLLNNYKPLKIAETFMLLSEIFPNRIDLGIGRSSSGPIIDNALMTFPHIDNYEEKFSELICWLNKKFPENSKYKSLSFPNSTNKPQLFILGSSLSSATLAGKNGIPYVFADFFSPKNTKLIFKEYQKAFVLAGNPSKPYSILSLRIVVGETEEDVQRLIAPLELMKQKLKNKTFTQISNSEEAISELGGLPKFQNEFSFGEGSPLITVGTPSQIKDVIKKKINNLKIDEIMFQDFIFNYEKKLAAYKLLAKELIDKENI